MGKLRLGRRMRLAQGHKVTWGQAGCRTWVSWRLLQFSVYIQGQFAKLTLLLLNTLSEVFVQNEPQFSSVAQSCPTFCEPMDCSMPGFPLLHHLLELAQTHVQQVSDATQPSHLLSHPSPPTFNLSQHQGLFQWVSSLHQVAKVWSFSFSISPSSEYSGLISFRMGWFDLLAVQGTLKSLLQYHSSKASILPCTREALDPPESNSSALEKRIANHFSILALRIPWTVWKGKMSLGHYKHYNRTTKSLAKESICPTLHEIEEFCHEGHSWTQCVTKSSRGSTWWPTQAQAQRQEPELVGDYVFRVIDS